MEDAADDTADDTADEEDDVWEDAASEVSVLTDEVGACDEAVAELLPEESNKVAAVTVLLAAERAPDESFAFM